MPQRTQINAKVKILKYLFSLYENERYQKYILKLLLSHTQSGLSISVSEIIENDSNSILSFFNSSLDTNNLYHCIVVQQYLKLLKRFNIPIEEKLKIQFQSPSYVLYDLLTNKFERVELKTDDRNEQSKNAIMAIGGKFEGILRSHTLMFDGYRRDTTYYGILKGEWESIKKSVFKNIMK